MQYVSLGNTGLTVSRLCFGGLIIGPLQANLPAGQGADVIVEALRLGVNFIDTAELYETYPHIREAIKRLKENLLFLQNHMPILLKALGKALKKRERKWILMS